MASEKRMPGVQEEVDRNVNASFRQKMRAMRYSLSYGFLAPKQEEIRLIDLLPLNNGNIECKIGIFLVSRAPAYYALSYVWGDPGVTDKITVEGEPFEVTINLKLALLDLTSRRDNEPLWIWVDAICINQDLPLEKNFQVTMMGQIYTNAFATWVWLGPDSEMTQLGFYNVKRLADCSVDNNLSSINLEEILESKADVSHVHATIDSIRFGFGSPQGIYLLPIFMLLKHPWWSRIWAIQESALQSNVVFICGLDDFCWEHLRHAMWALHCKMHLGSDFENLSIVAECLNLYRGMDSFRIAVQYSPGVLKNTGGRLSLMDALQEARDSNFQCTDPRDHVYGLLGMVNDFTASKVTVNYGATVRTVFIQTSKVLLSIHGLKMLHLCCLKLETGDGPRHIQKIQGPKDSFTDIMTPLSSTEFKAHRFPSWVPIWSDQNQGLRMLAQTSTAEYRASSGLPQTKETFYLDDSDILTVTGAVADNIFKLIQPAKAFNSLNDWLREIAQLLSNSAVYSSGENINEAIFRTSCVNQINPFAAKGFTEITDHNIGIIQLLLSQKEPLISLASFARVSEGDHEWKDSKPRVGSADVTESEVAGDNDRGVVRLEKFINTKISIPPSHKENDDTRTQIRNYVYSILKLLEDTFVLFITQKGYLGIGPASVDTGDLICIISTAAMPIILRKSSSQNRYVLVGETYVQGLMNGEFQSSEIQHFDLV